MFHPENENLIKRTVHGCVKSTSIISFSFLSVFCLFFISSKVLFAAPFSTETLAIFDSKLEIAAENIAEQVLGREKKVVIAVVDIFNYETQERDVKAELLEEQLSDLLFEKLPNQVVPYFEIVYLRLEWRSRFPEILHDPLTEDIAKLTNADWLLTGTYESIRGLLSVNLNLYELKSGDLLWQTVVGKQRIEENEQEEITPEEIATQEMEQTSSEPSTQKITQFHAPVLPSISRYPSFEQERSTQKKTELFSTPIPALPPPVEEEVQKIPHEMVLISEGEFLMGSDFGDEDELPDHLVFINSFYLDQHEVTNLDYSECLSCERGHGGFDTIDPQQPAVYVDWNNADAYCKTQNKRLPTEAEWEYAARAGSESEYSFGDNVSFLENYAWVETNTTDLGLWGARKVSSKIANQWGLFDLYGNVMEWVQNYYTQDYFISVRQPNNPKGPSLPLDENYPLRVVRGGAWGGLYGAGTPAGVRSAKRYAFTEWTRSFQIGFRCAMDVFKKIETN